VQTRSLRTIAWPAEVCGPGGVRYGSTGGTYVRIG
jgi:hypothetical protein